MCQNDRFDTSPYQNYFIFAFNMKASPGFNT